jgi:hypothetical protein
MKTGTTGRLIQLPDVYPPVFTTKQTLREMRRECLAFRREAKARVKAMKAKTAMKMTTMKKPMKTQKVMKAMKAPMKKRTKNTTKEL